jgi:hypothetical protein
MNDSPVDCQNVKLPQATFVTRAAARPTETLVAKKIVEYRMMLCRGDHWSPALTIITK